MHPYSQTHPSQLHRRHLGAGDRSATALFTCVAAASSAVLSSWLAGCSPRSTCHMVACRASSGAPPPDTSPCMASGRGTPWLQPRVGASGRKAGHDGHASRPHSRGAPRRAQPATPRLERGWMVVEGSESVRGAMRWAENVQRRRVEESMLLSTPGSVCREAQGRPARTSPLHFCFSCRNSTLWVAFLSIA